jgi:hypothetical protein
MTNEIVSGAESGVHTHELVERGPRPRSTCPRWALTRDVGSLTYRVTFDEKDRKIDSKSCPYVRHTQPSKKTFSARHSYRALGLD